MQRVFYAGTTGLLVRCHRYPYRQIHRKFLGRRQTQKASRYRHRCQVADLAHANRICKWISSGRVCENSFYNSSRCKVCARSCKAPNRSAE